jgi:hypothetical protein
MALNTGRVFRKMGLPMWTFLGIGIAAIWFNYFGALLERGLRDLLSIDDKTQGFRTYLPPLFVFTIPFVAIGLALLRQRVLNQAKKMETVDGVLYKPEGKKGLIILVSKLESAMFAIDYHFKEKGTLEFVWLIPSSDIQNDKFGPNTLSVAEALKKQCEELGRQSRRKLDATIHKSGVSPADSQDTFEYVQRIFRQSNYNPSELIADFTGGTKPMTVGMIMACLPAERELEYVTFNPQTKQSYGPFLIDYQHSVFNLVG